MPCTARAHEDAIRLEAALVLHVLLDDAAAAVPSLHRNTAIDDAAVPSLHRNHGAFLHLGSAQLAQVLLRQVVLTRVANCVGDLSRSCRTLSQVFKVHRILQHIGYVPCM